MEKFNGQVLFLNKADINTDEIIPAKYLTEISKQGIGSHLLEDLELEHFSAPKDIIGKAAIITRSNFGCGSSREHAPWALAAKGINLVIAESYARIFRQNMFNCGMLAIELSKEEIDYIFNKYSLLKTDIKADIASMEIILTKNQKKEKFVFSISDFDKALVNSGGWVDFAESHY